MRGWLTPQVEGIPGVKSSKGGLANLVASVSLPREVAALTIPFLSFPPYFIPYTSFPVPNILNTRHWVFSLGFMRILINHIPLRIIFQTRVYHSHSSFIRDYHYPAIYRDPHKTYGLESGMALTSLDIGHWTLDIGH